MASSRGSRRPREGVAALPGSIADATLARRRRRSRHRRVVYRRLALLGAAVVLVLVLFWVVMFSPILAARTVEVSGTKVLTGPQVTTTAAVPLGRPLVRVDTAEIAHRVAALPQVERVRVDRSWPRSITIEVTERQPVLQRREAGRWQWVDATGRAFHEVDARNARLVEVEAPQEQRLLADCATVASSLTPALRQALVRLSADSPDTITLHLSGGRQVIWGAASESDTKAEVATALLKVKAKVYDVSSPANPTSR